MKQACAALFGLLGALAATGAAEARPGKAAELVLASAPAGPVKQVIDGRIWRCLGSGCRGTDGGAPKSQPVVFECQRVVAELGAVTLYRSGGRELTAGELERCNAGARRR